MNEITDKEYFSLPALSKSGLKYWDIFNPMAFWAKCPFNPDSKKEPISDALIRGTLFHSILLEPNTIQKKYIVCDAYGKSRINKKWIEAQEKEDKIIITTEELAQAEKMITAISRHQILRDLLSGGKSEEYFLWYDKIWDIPCKMKTDYIKNTEEGLYIIDYKTTSYEVPLYIDKNKFEYDVGFYTRGAKEKYKREVSKFIFIFQSSKENDENNIRIKVVEGANLEACQIATDVAVKQIVPRIKGWQKAENNDDKLKFWLPDIQPEIWDISAYFDKKIADTTL